MAMTVTTATRHERRHHSADFVTAAPAAIPATAGIQRPVFLSRFLDAVKLPSHRSWAAPDFYAAGRFNSLEF